MTKFDKSGKEDSPVFAALAFGLDFFHLGSLVPFSLFSCLKTPWIFKSLSYPVPCTGASGFHSAQYAANHYSQMNDCANTSQNFCTTPLSLSKSYSYQPSTPYMLPTISYYNSVSNLHRHESMEGQLDRASSKNSHSSNAGIDLVL
jgi:hypothetical protein